jgi:uncharacterized protein YdeI (YjbR/CyaY-like superfamily)
VLAAVGAWYDREAPRIEESRMQLYFTGREAWRSWLADHHQTEREVWLIFYKAHAGKLSISYEAAVEEALCFGWIDSIIKKLDGRRYMRKFTPRTNTRKWSASNLARVKRLVNAGLMTDVGLAKLDPGVEPQAPPATKDWPMPRFFSRALANNRTARENFDRLAPSHKRSYIIWLTTAKRPETRARRVVEAISSLRRNRKLGLK